MANKPESDCSCVIDTSGLHELATASGNLKATLIASLDNGTIGVPSWAWQEFKDLYEDEAKELAPHVSKRLQLTPHVEVRAARITEELNLGFSRGAYDNHVELHTASIALNKGYKVLTSANNVSAYDGMDCPVLDLAGWVNETN
ncbi:hypothetical protein [Bradyrhizobium sp. NP1]|uniref:hypothetical protein n=1 Tax=Bradyrhizobium sp. NP1 TaxID=3049772 RepID=UPI0025A511F3|nr:hypothetical protein [Bradyrhizobium sp. NP1]WJR77072.1 hypothetical protein QOU61_30700 [Bradyrhizobium sp. NP1]